jgi:type 1 glutamine amidotransferase/sugar phosphate isomerase/epimerase
MRSKKDHYETLQMLLSAVLMTIAVVTNGLAQPPAGSQAGTSVVRITGPYGPSPVGRSGWRVPPLDFRIEIGPCLGWKVGVPASAFRGLTLTEAVIRTDIVALGYVEGSNRQWVSPEIRKNLDYKLSPAELTAAKNRLRKFAVQMVAYHVDSFGPDESTRRKVFEFAKSLGVEMIVVAPEPAALPAIDKLANEFGINVAIESLGRKETPAYWQPKNVLAALQGRSSRIGVRVDTGAWMREGINPKEALAQLKDKLMAVSLRDLSSHTPTGREVPLSYGAGDVKQILQELYRLKLRSLFFTLNTTGEVDATADLARSVDGFEQAVLPVLGDYMVQRSKLLAIRGPNELTDDVKQQIEAAIPRVAPAKPQKSRKLLIMDERGPHTVIPHANYALELLGKKTGAYEPVLSNDLDNLKYDKIRQFDAVMLNSTEVDATADPAVREGLLRYVREGGGLGGIHAAAWTLAFWPEFMEMMGASQGPHRAPEKATWKIDDPDSPLTKTFGGQPFTYTDEYYRMTDTGLQGTYYSRDKVHVLLSIDMALSPDFYAGRVPFIRKDNDYAISWIKGYGKGRVFYSGLGHMPDMFMQPKIGEHILAAVQFLLGDLPADTTPSAELPARW